MLKTMLRAGAVAAFGLAAVPAQSQDKVRISFNPQIYSYMPVFLAIDKGYFKEQKIDLEFSTYGGSALSQLPMLARGDQDIAGMVTGPGFFNQHAEGFGIKLIASLAESKRGWHDTMWVMVRKDIWDTGAIKTFADFKGRQVEGGPKGSPIYLTTLQALKQGGLTTKDVTFTERMRSVSDVLPLMRNMAIDIISIVEPIAGRLEAEGLAVRWKAAYEVLPNYQEAFLAANPKFLAEKRDVTKRFLIAYLKGAKDVTAGGGKWTPDMRAAMIKYAKLTDEVLEKIPGPQHAGQMGKIELESIQRQQDIWIAEGMVKVKTPLAELIDTSIIDEIRKEQGIQ
jgi:NitT/TauT family transport system substrate-binding protein